MIACAVADQAVMHLSQAFAAFGGKVGGAVGSKVAAAALHALK
jgi:hypothetical protein